jgi:hypothetical protein
MYGLLIRVWYFVLAITAVVMANSVAAQGLNIKDMVTAKGECRMELVRGAGYGPCNDLVIYMLFKNGRHMLSFSNKNDVITVAGSGDRQPRLEDYYMNIDTLRIKIPGHKEVVDRNMEGECHIRLTKESGDFLGIECDTYDRTRGIGLSSRVDNIVESKHQHFD